MAENRISTLIVVARNAWCFVGLVDENREVAYQRECFLIEECIWTLRYSYFGIGS